MAKVEFGVFVLLSREGGRFSGVCGGVPFVEALLVSLVFFAAPLFFFERDGEAVNSPALLLTC